jgi:hypothetical protein
LAAKLPKPKQQKVSSLLPQAKKPLRLEQPRRLRKSCEVTGAGVEMALILKGNAIFLHVPKTGGTWVSKILEECGLLEDTIGAKHADIDRIFSPIANSGRKLAQYYLKKRLGRVSRERPLMFCFVRHPLSWYESYFRFMSAAAQNWRAWGDENDINLWHPNAMLNGTEAPDFNQFVRNVIRKRPGYVTEMYGWYTRPPVDFIGKQENLYDDLIQVLSMLNVPFDEQFIRNYPRQNVSSKPAKPLEWDPNLREELYKLEYAGIYRYGYLEPVPAQKA